jgi:YqaJ-like viral recombinase domain
MLRGKELEGQALEYFNFVYGYNFKKCGFMEAVCEAGNPLGFGASPDGIDLTTRTGLELKCPDAHTHLAYLTSAELPDKYFQQVQTAIMVSGFDKWVFGSYYPSLPCFRIEVPRDDKFIEVMRPLFIEVSELIKQKHLMISKMMEAV